MATPRINGNMFSWASVTIRVNATLVSAIKSITYGDSRERSKGYGQGRHFGPIGQTSGKYTTDKVVCEIEKGELQALRQAIADASGSGSFGDLEFQIVVQYEEPDRGVITDEINGCTWGKNSASTNDGGDPNYESVEFDCLSIKWDGLTLYSEAQ